MLRIADYCRISDYFQLSKTGKQVVVVVDIADMALPPGLEIFKWSKEVCISLRSSSMLESGLTNLNVFLRK